MPGYECGESKRLLTGVGHCAILSDWLRPLDSMSEELWLQLGLLYQYQSASGLSKSTKRHVAAVIYRNAVCSPSATSNG